MAGNTRGRLKERFEGIHRNFDWVIEHCNRSVVLLEALPEPHTESTTKLIAAIKAIAEAVIKLDGLAQNIYSTL